MSAVAPLTVIIPAYNSAATLGEAVRSAVSAVDGNGEVIVVDDGSTDATYDLAMTLLQECYTGVGRVLRQQNLGVSAARNAGLVSARSPVVLYLDADDTLIPSGVHSMRVRQADEGCDIVVGLAIDRFGSEYREQPRERLAGSSHLARLVENWWAVSTVLLKKNNLQWQDGMRKWEVLDFFVRQLIAKCHVSYVTEYVTIIDHSPVAHRATLREDHYEPASMAMFFLNLKRAAVACGQADLALRRACDYQIIQSAYRATRTGASFDFSALAWVDRSQLPQHEKFRILGPSGFSWLLGPAIGLRAHAAIAALFHR